MKVDPALLKPGMVVVWDYNLRLYVFKEFNGEEASIETWFDKQDEDLVGMRWWNIPFSELWWPVCRCCRSDLVGEAAIPKPDPYAWDIHNDKTPVLQCDHCAEESARDI